MDIKVKKEKEALILFANGDKMLTEMSFTTSRKAFVGLGANAQIMRDGSVITSKAVPTDFSVKTHGKNTI